MASYHLSAQPVKRSEGRSVVAMAAYRSGALLKDERRGLDVDYRRRRGVVHEEILAPEGAAPWLLNRERPWNAVERMEVRKDAQLAREINMALPHELTDEQRLELTRSFILEQFVSQGMVADFAIHAPVVEKGDDPRNFHAHVLLTLRQAGPKGLWDVKTRQWNSRRELAAWRKAWAEAQNGYLQQYGHRARVDHRSLGAQRAEAQKRGDRVGVVRLDRAPEIHVGPHATAISKQRVKAALQRRPRRGEPEQVDHSERGAINQRRLKANAHDLDGLMAKATVQLARLRRRQLRYEQQATERRDDRAADGEARYLHALKRKRELAMLIQELDGLFFSLLGIRESRLVRLTEWSNRRGWRFERPMDLSGRVRTRDLS